MKFSDLSLEARQGVVVAAAVSVVIGSIGVVIIAVMIANRLLFGIGNHR